MGLVTDDDATDGDGETDEAGTEELDGLVMEGIEHLKSMMEGVPGGQRVAKLLDQIDLAGDDDDADEDVGEEEEDDPDLYDVYYEDSRVWQEAHRERLDVFLRSWPAVRGRVLDAAFTYYRDHYEDIWAFWGGEDHDKLTLPDPTDRSVVEDLFRIDAFYLREAPNNMGISGHCTWDDEHGFGAVIKDGEVEVFGQASDAF
ncbi:MAG: hypothetical protein AAF797_16440 [Planctomycetota bacterium]